MMPESLPEPQPEILDYIRANRGMYNRAVIERELREAGHDQKAIDAAWRTFLAEGEAVSARKVIATVRFWVAFVGAAVVALLVLPLLSFLGFYFFVFAAFSGGWLSNASTRVKDIVSLSLIFGPFVFGYLAIGLGGRWLARRDRVAALGVFSGLVIAFVLSVIVAGSRAAIFTQL